MSILARLQQWWQKRCSSHALALNEWYFVSFDDEELHVRAEPPGREARAYSRRWEEIVRIGFEAGDVFESDSIYLFLRGEEASRCIPTEGNGGDALWL